MDKKGFDAHHVFPRKFEGDLEDLGINIHAPKYAVWWEASEHRQAAKAYNDEFGAFLDSPDAEDAGGVLEFGRSLMKKYGIDVDF